MEIDNRYLVVFFAGGESRDDKFNVFTGNFIHFLSEILEDRFRLIKGIYFRFPMFNVAWGLNNAQKPFKDSSASSIVTAAVKQLIPTEEDADVTLIMLSSSNGSIVAAQAACVLAKEIKSGKYYRNPFHIVLGTNFISKESDLFKSLLGYQKEGIIGKIIFDELQDEGDSVYQAGGKTRSEAWINAFGLILPWLSKKYNPPSFLNTHPEKGHLHRRRSQTIKKVRDFIEVIFIKNKIAGDFYCQRAVSLLSEK